jgi:molybdenum cofactor cytidylyltransferase
MMCALGAIVLAAGKSERFGTENKLLAEVGGDRLIRKVVREALGSGIEEVVVVTGWDEPRIAATLEDLSARRVYNKNWRSGIGTSVAAGVAALRPDIEGAFVVPGDMARLNSILLGYLARAFEEVGRRVVVFPVTADGDQRNPVLWPRRYFEKLMRLSGPQGAKGLLQSPEVARLAVPIEDEATLEDIDTLDDLQRMQPPAPTPH